MGAAARRARHCHRVAGALAKRFGQHLLSRSRPASSGAGNAGAVGELLMADVDPPYLFVYGTLMQAYDHPMARLLSEQAERLGEGSCCGQLYQIKHYPGLIASNDPADRVFGELFRLRDTKSLLAQLDDYEGCGASAPQPTLY